MYKNSILDKSVKEKIKFFFRNPTEVPEKSDEFSILYLLRRDIKMCLGIDPNNNTKIGYQALWPGTMAILAGIDLVAKFYEGNDETRNGAVGKRFRQFLKEYFGLNNEEQKTIYQLRNSLLHSFGLYSKDRKGNEYKFVLTSKQESVQLVQCMENNNYLIDIRTLHKQFEIAIEKYQTDVIADVKYKQILQENFSKMFPKYSATNIG